MSEPIYGTTEFYHAIADAAAAEAVGNRPWSKKVKSVALAVHPDQIAEAAEDARKRGVPTEFTADGCPVLTDRDHKKRYLRAYGYYDRDAGYGDAAPIYHKGEKAPPSRLRELGRKLADRIRVRRESRTN